MKVLYIATEQTPYSTVGGLGRVAYFLPKELQKLGIDVRVIMPKYGKIDEKKAQMETVLHGLHVPTQEGFNDLICNVKMSKPEGMITYFLENQEYYELRANEYGYFDDPLRFTLLCRGALEFLRHSQNDWVPDVIHSNDWQTALISQMIPAFYSQDDKLSHIVTLYSIHNLAYQGMYDYRFVSDLDFDDGKSNIPGFYDPRLSKINMMRRGIMYSDVVNTVSPTYAAEILTEEYGAGLQRLLQELRTKLFGILNGIDYVEFNPLTDKLVVENFNQESTEKRKINKCALQKEFQLPEDDEIPILAISNRLDSQKGIDLVIQIIEPILDEYAPVQLIVNGGGDDRFREFFAKLAKKYPYQVGVNLNPNFTLPRHIFSGADVILLPSRFEPCGMTQMEAMRYGCIPLVRNTGGLADTVSDYDPVTREGTGFVFDHYEPFALFGSIVRALETFKHKDEWENLVKRAMNQDFSWTKSAQEYKKLYERAVELRRQTAQSKSHFGYK
ncbi:MAG: glycogen synthase [bacterium]|nr:glycogen synthase [bacterium]